MQEFNVTIEGVTPLLQNRFLEAQLEGGSKKKTGAERALDPHAKLYVLPDGTIYQPAVCITRCLVDAGKNFQIKGKRKATYSKLFGSSIAVEPDAIPHKNQKWIPFSISAVNPMTKGRMMVVRPMFQEWKLSFALQVLDEGITMEVVKEALDYAGMYVGIGDWRPEKKGKYGKFIVTKFEAV